MLNSEGMDPTPVPRNFDEALARPRICLLVLLSVPLAIIGCTSTRHLVPASTAQIVPGQTDPAVAEVEGVRVAVTPDTWSGEPSSLDREMTPLKVSIENRGTHPLRISYGEFSLTSSTGVSYAALPPYKIAGSVTGGVAMVPRFTYYGGFYVAPYYAPYYATLPPWSAAWPLDSYYYDEYYPAWQIQLPTRDMRERAIPEGVVNPQGGVTGFLYFPKLAREAQSVTFELHLTDANSGNRFGKLSIPFDVH